MRRKQKWLAFLIVIFCCSSIGYAQKNRGDILVMLNGALKDTSISGDCRQRLQKIKTYVNKASFTTSNTPAVLQHIQQLMQGYDKGDSATACAKVLLILDQALPRMMQDAKNTIRGDSLKAAKAARTADSIKQAKTVRPAADSEVAKPVVADTTAKKDSTPASVKTDTGLQQDKDTGVSWLTIVALLLLLVLLAAFVLLLRLLHREKTEAHRRQQAVAGTLNRLSAQLELLGQQQAQVEEKLLQLSVPRQEPQQVRPAVINPVVVTAPAGAQCFRCEIMMTAGPRKKALSDPGSDVDLGEDICGCQVYGSEVYCWVLDGMSDMDVLKDETGKEYFSGRLLAQSLATRINNALPIAEKTALSALVDLVILDVKTDWNMRLQQLSGNEKEKLRAAIAGKNYPFCGTTLLLAALTLDGDFNSVRFGDSKMLLFGTSTHGLLLRDSVLADKETATPSIFFKIDVQPGGELRVDSNPVKPEIVAAQQIQALIGFSDGIGAATEAFLRSYAGDPEATRNEISSQVQGTRDDKTLCFISIRQAGAGDIV